MDFTTILNLIKRRTNTQNTTTSSYPIADKVTDVNNALNKYFIIANGAAGNWRPVDDTNQTDYPIIQGNLVTNQQDYTLATDEDGNQILDIYKVRILNPDGITWTTLSQINQDQITDSDLQTVTSGVPSQYYLNSNGIFLVQKPSYTTVNGMEIWINRTPTYFTVSDTTKKAGIPWVHHEYLALRPAWQYCSDKGLSNASDLKEQLFGKDGKSGLEGDIAKYYRDRNKNFQVQITSEPINSI